MKPEEARKNLVRIVREQGPSVASAARDLNFSVRSAARFLTDFRDVGGEVHYDPDRWNSHHGILKDNQKLRYSMFTAIEEDTELFLDELADNVNLVAARVDGDVGVSPTTVARLLADNGYARTVI